MVEPVIDCIDCGGICHVLAMWDDDDPPIPGDVVTYRCQDCNDRWDIVVPETGDEQPT